MTPLIACTHCGLVLRVLGDDAEAETLVGPRAPEWPDGFSCASCGRGAKGLLESEAAASALKTARLVDVTPQEAFAALNGFGLPDERTCTGEVVNSLLRSTAIRRVAGQDIPGAQRFRIEHIELVDGTRIYLGAGGDGAVVYRIAAPVSYVARVLGGAQERPGKQEDEHV